MPIVPRLRTGKLKITLKTTDLLQDWGLSWAKDAKKATLNGWPFWCLIIVYLSNLWLELE